MADNRFERRGGRAEPSRAEAESALRQALDATSLTQAYQAVAEHTRKPPELRLLRGGASGPSGEDRWYTIADVAKACGLPQPVIAQLVPRTWTKDGWMYTGAQRLSAIQIARKMRAPQAD